MREGLVQVILSFQLRGIAEQFCALGGSDSQGSGNDQVATIITSIELTVVTTAISTCPLFPSQSAPGMRALLLPFTYILHRDYDGT